uniref:(California timema) hypothetical protein n=1 Tax=Timema californicum TaxID=61474 RepID=A0A7R9JCZ1_TIMCA|nr:unnamed protein product [Timema californicum]
MPPPILRGGLCNSTRDFEHVATNQDGKNGETPSVHDGKRSLHHKALFTHRPHVTRCPDLIGYLEHHRLSCDHHEGRQHGLANLYGQTSFLHSPMVGSHVTTTRAETLADNTRRCKFRTVHSSDTYCSDVCLQIGHREHLSKLARGCSLGHMLQFDDADKDGRLNINEFYMAFSVSVVSLDKALEVNHLSARVGDNVEIKCDVTGTPPPPIVWRRNEADLSSLDEEEVRVFVDGSLYLTRIQLLHAGNYTCHAQRNKDVVQTHVLTVHSQYSTSSPCTVSIPPAHRAQSVFHQLTMHSQYSTSSPCTVNIPLVHRAQSVFH